MTLVKECTEVIVGGQALAVAQGRSLLETADECGIEIPSSCRSGVCQSCLMKTVEGSPPASAQKGLKPALQQQGFFHACMCYPDQPFSCEIAKDASTRFLATVLRTSMLGSDVLQMRLSVSPEFNFHGGQFINLRRHDGLTRSYSIASLPEDGPFLDIHVRLTPGGQMSQWLHHTVMPGDQLEVSGPWGDCFYLTESTSEPLLLVGTGTGIAPLYAILRDALRHNHAAPIYLFQGGLHRDRLYLVEELSQLAEQYPQLHYTQCLLQGDNVSNARTIIGDLRNIVLSHIALLKKARAFLCGDADTVNLLRKRLFLGGLSLKNIAADAFISAGSVIK
jgi:CDP-4-dehydro-6-deoxyglucose reductase, E3